MQNERKVLVSALLKAEKDGYSNLILDNVLKETEFDSVSKGFVTSAFYGVIERKNSLDFILNKYLKKPIEKAPPYTASVLRSGAYQIIFMDKIPNSAAVNESVKLIKKSKESGNSGLVNAVLRKVSDENSKEVIEKFSDAVVKFSINKWIYETLCNDYSKEIAEDFLNVSLTPPTVFIRLNPLKEGAFDIVSAELKQSSGKLIKTDCEDVFIAEGIRGIDSLNSFKKGVFFVQDYSSRIAAKALKAKAGDRVLDCCAAPGGKSFSIALDMQNNGEIISSDIYPARVSLIQNGAKRLGISIIKPIVCDASKFNDQLGLFDKVICDAPCSGVGVIRRKPEIKYKKYEECLNLTRLQSDILQNASRYVKPNGRLVYSTCTLLKRENELIVEAFLKHNTDFKLVSPFEGVPAHTITRIPPKDLGDGFFIATMERV